MSLYAYSHSGTYLGLIRFVFFLSFIFIYYFCDHYASLQCYVLDLLEIIVICWFAAQETFTCIIYANSLMNRKFKRSVIKIFSNNVNVFTVTFPNFWTVQYTHIHTDAFKTSITSLANLTKPYLCYPASQHYLGDKSFFYNNIECFTENQM